MNVTLLLPALATIAPSKFAPGPASAISGDVRWDGATLMRLDAGKF